MTAPRGDVFWYRGETPRGTPLDRDLTVREVLEDSGNGHVALAEGALVELLIAVEQKRGSFALEIRREG